MYFAVGKKVGFKVKNFWDERCESGANKKAAV
jgi:hypothetical protein